MKYAVQILKKERKTITQRIKSERTFKKEYQKYKFVLAIKEAEKKEKYYLKLLDQIDTALDTIHQAIENGDNN